MYLFKDFVADFVNLLGDIFLKFLEFQGYFFDSFLQFFIEGKLADFKLIQKRIEAGFCL
jgi:hypothetical protein